MCIIQFHVKYTKIKLNIIHFTLNIFAVKSATEGHTLSSVRVAAPNLMTLSPNNYTGGLDKMNGIEYPQEQSRKWDNRKMEVRGNE